MRRPLLVTTALFLVVVSLSCKSSAPPLSTPAPTLTFAPALTPTPGQALTSRITAIPTPIKTSTIAPMPSIQDAIGTVLKAYYESNSFPVGGQPDVEKIFKCVVGTAIQNYLKETLVQTTLSAFREGIGIKYEVEYVRELYITANNETLVTVTQTMTVLPTGLPKRDDRRFKLIKVMGEWKISDTMKDDGRWASEPPLPPVTQTFGKGQVANTSLAEITLNGARKLKRLDEKITRNTREAPTRQEYILVDLTVKNLSSSTLFLDSNLKFKITSAPGYTFEPDTFYSSPLLRPLPDSISGGAIGRGELVFTVPIEEIDLRLSLPLSDGTFYWELEMPTLSPTLTPTTPTPPPPTPTPVIRTFSKGDAAKTSLAEITLNGARKLKMLDENRPQYDKREAPAGQEYVLVDLTVKNLSSETLSLGGTLKFKINSVAGYVFEPDSSSTFYLLRPLPNSISGGATVRGELVFNIPIEENHLRLMLSVTGGTYYWEMEMPTPPMTPTPTPTPTPTRAPTAGPPKQPANHAGRTTCMVCHKMGIAGAPKSPANHAGRTDTTCVACHGVP